MNVVALTGRLTKDPEIKSTSSGKSVVSFCIAVQNPYVKDDVDYPICVAWESNAEFISKYFTKGMKIEVEGQLKTRTYEKNGVKNLVTEVRVNTVGFAERKNKDNTEKERDSHHVNNDDLSEFDEVLTDDGVPF